MLYSEEGSRPNAPINTLVAALILQHQRGWTYAELIKQIDFDLTTRTALGLWDLETTPFSRATLFNFQNRLAAHWAATGGNLLERVFDEHCHLVESEGEHSVAVKKPQDIPSDAVQNPPDPDASYDGHTGQGYQVQVMETYSPDTTGEHINVLTHVSVESADKSDANALLPAIEQTEADQVKPDELLVDSLYRGGDNVAKAKEHGVEVISPVMGRPVSEERVELADCVMDENAQVESCPNGCTPVKQGYKKSRYSLSFEKQCCETCPLRDQCPSKEGTRYYYVRFSTKALKASRRRRYQQSDAFREKYRWRAGVEATMSAYDRRTGGKQIRVRGSKRVRFAAVMKAVGVNLFRAARYYGAFKQKMGENWRPGTEFGLLLKMILRRWTALCDSAEKFFRMPWSKPIIASQIK